MLYVSLGTKTDDHKLVRDTPKELEKDHKATRKKMEPNRSWTGGPRQPRAHGPPRPRVHGLLRELAHGPNLPRAHGLIRMDDYDLHSEPLFLHFVPKAIYSVPRPYVRGRQSS